MTLQIKSNIPYNWRVAIKGFLKSGMKTRERKKLEKGKF